MIEVAPGEIKNIGQVLDPELAIMMGLSFGKVVDMYILDAMGSDTRKMDLTQPFSHESEDVERKYMDAYEGVALLARTALEQATELRPIGSRGVIIAGALTFPHRDKLSAFRLQVNISNEPITLLVQKNECDPSIREDTGPFDLKKLSETDVDIVRALPGEAIALNNTDHRSKKLHQGGEMFNGRYFLKVDSFVGEPVPEEGGDISGGVTVNFEDTHLLQAK